MTAAIQHYRTGNGLHTCPRSRLDTPHYLIRDPRSASTSAWVCPVELNAEREAATLAHRREEGAEARQAKAEQIAEEQFRKFYGGWPPSTADAGIREALTAAALAGLEAQS
ncbi:hypothetical protein ACFVAJ_17260 [Agromyces sp. NPDC057679]|uniref:hypothetical protein n=1 Tax=Agromyces sp. NPDC057679 TaxID=3346207 RepID=UPI0036733487